MLLKRLFIEKVSTAMAEIGKDLVLNLVETSVKITFQPKKSPNFKDKRMRVRSSVTEKKVCFIAVRIVDANRHRYDPLIIAKGPLKRSGKIIDELIHNGYHIHGQLISQNGWMTSVTMLDVLDYVAKIRDNTKSKSDIYLVLDVFRACLREDVKKRRSELKIKLINYYSSKRNCNL